jgi:hypothetical protein
MNTARPRLHLAVYLLAALLFYAVFLLVTTPASWMGVLLNRLTRGTVDIQRTNGSFWHGGGDLAVRAGTAQAMQVRVNWSIQPLWLLAGKLQTQVESSGDIDLRATIRLGYRSVDVRDCSGGFPLTTASAIYVPLTLATLTGRVQFSAARLAVDSSGLHGAAEVKWLNAGSRMGGLGEVGDYRLALAGQGAAAGIQVDTLRGDAQLNAKGEWQIQGDGMLTLDGTLTPGSHEAALTPLVTLLNARRNGNQYSFNIRARVPSPLSFR